MANEPIFRAEKGAHRHGVQIPRHCRDAERASRPSGKRQPPDVGAFQGPSDVRPFHGKRERVHRSARQFLHRLGIREWLALCAAPRWSARVHQSPGRQNARLPRLSRQSAIYQPRQRRCRRSRRVDHGGLSEPRAAEDSGAHGSSRSCRRPRARSPAGATRLQGEGRTSVCVAPRNVRLELSAAHHAALHGIRHRSRGGFADQSHRRTRGGEPGATRRQDPAARLSGMRITPDRAAW